MCRTSDKKLSKTDFKCATKVEEFDIPPVDRDYFDWQEVDAIDPGPDVETDEEREAREREEREKAEREREEREREEREREEREREEREREEREREEREREEREQ